MEKFVLLPEKGENNLFLMLPLISSIEKKFPDAEISIVHTLNLSNQLMGLKKSVKFFTVNESDFGPLASIKLASRLDDLFNISHVLCFRTEAGPLHFAKALKAKYRLGWKSLLNDVFLTNPHPRPDHLSPMERYSVLWEDSSFGEKKYESVAEESKEKTPENFFKAESSEPFLFFAVDFEIESENLLSFISLIIEDLKDFRVIVWSEKPCDSMDELKLSFPHVIDASEASVENLHHYLIRCRGFVSNITWLCSQASFLLVESFLIGREIVNLPYFKCEPVQAELADENKVILLKGDTSENISYSDLVDLIYKKYSL